MITLLLAAWLPVATLAALALGAAIRRNRPALPRRQPGTPAADRAAIQAEALRQLDRGLDNRPGTDREALSACNAIWNTTAREEDA